MRAEGSALAATVTLAKYSHTCCGIVGERIIRFMTWTADGGFAEEESSLLSLDCRMVHYAVPPSTDRL